MSNEPSIELRVPYNEDMIEDIETALSALHWHAGTNPIIEITGLALTEGNLFLPQAVYIIGGKPYTESDLPSFWGLFLRNFKLWDYTHDEENPLVRYIHPKPLAIILVPRLPSEQALLLALIAEVENRTNTEAIRWYYNRGPAYGWGRPIYHVVWRYYANEFSDFLYFHGNFVVNNITHAWRENYYPPDGAHMASSLSILMEHMLIARRKA